MHLLDPKDPTSPVEIDVEELALLAHPVMATHFPDWGSEEAHDDHTWHDDDVAGCAHCAVATRHRGDGFAVALARTAVALERAAADECALVDDDGYEAVPDYGGVYDGLGTVSSDADPGL